MDDAMRAVEEHPEGRAHETHYLTIQRLGLHSNHNRVLVVSDCGLEIEACLHGVFVGRKAPPSCQVCATRGLLPGVLDDVLSALDAAGDLCRAT